MTEIKKKILFVCTGNSIRSQMAEGLLRALGSGPWDVRSAGVIQSYVHPLAIRVMEEIGIDIHSHGPMTFEELEDLEGLNFDLIVTLSPEAHHKALDLTRTLAAEVEYWPTPDPTAVEGNREQRLNAYRAVRDLLVQKIRERFVTRASVNE